MGITSKRLVATLHRTYNPIQRLTFIILGMRSSEPGQKPNRPQACRELFQQLCVKDQICTLYIFVCVSLGMEIGDNQATLLAKRSFFPAWRRDLAINVTLHHTCTLSNLCGPFETEREWKAIWCVSNEPCEPNQNADISGANHVDHDTPHSSA